MNDVFTNSLSNPINPNSAEYIASIGNINPASIVKNLSSVILLIINITKAINKTIQYILFYVSSVNVV